MSAPRQVRWWVVALGVALAWALATCPLAAQRAVRVSSWVTELGAGTGADLLARGPWMAPSWRRSFWGRVGFATGLSLLYEYAVEPWNGQPNAAHWPDAAQRLVGTLALEALWSGVRRAT